MLLDLVKLDPNGGQCGVRLNCPQIWEETEGMILICALSVGGGGRQRNACLLPCWTLFLSGCPAIHPRCRWVAAPYQGRPKPLQLPLGFLYVHHTYVPASPCTDFERCAADMRSMQRFHQYTRGWDDIGYRWAATCESLAGRTKWWCSVEPGGAEPD